jgi:hypothetical protein
MLYGTLSVTTKKIIRTSMVVLVGLVTIYFIDVTVKRFSGNNTYFEVIPKESIIQDPVVFSCLDYLSQWYTNGMVLLEKYDYNTFKGQTSLQPVLSLMGEYGISSYRQADYDNLRKQLWPEHYYTFNGFVAYSIYDYGYFLTFILVLYYNALVKKFRPKGNVISLFALFSVVLLVQIPLFSIFYSNVSGIVFPLLFLIPIYFYLKLSYKNNPMVDIVNTNIEKTDQNVTK